ncbi:MAG: hypothetical protein ACOC8F_01430 [Planctomycetota bacterium]
MPPTTSADTEILLDRLCERINQCADRDRLALARRRHEAVMAGRPTDSLPLAFGDGRALGGEDWPAFDWAEQFHDPAKSLYMQLKGALSEAASTGDTAPSVRADTGVINCMTVFGAGYTVPQHTKPIVNEYVPKEALREFEVPADVSRCGVIPRMVEHMEHHVAALRRRGVDDVVCVRHCDQQGPFDIAAQTRGHEIFVDLYEDAEFVHELMGKCVDVYVAVSKLCKGITGEPLDGGNVYGVWMTNGGVRMCGDSDILVSVGQYDEFIAPYQQQAFAPFGGGWLHYCGGWAGTGRSEGIHLHEGYARVRGLRGLNWTTGRDWVGQMRKLRELGVVHIGGLRRNDGEPLDAYFRRALSAYEDRRGLIFKGPAIGADERDAAVDAWQRAQDERFGPA